MKRFLLESLASLSLAVMLVSTVYAAPPTQLWSDPIRTDDIALSKDGKYVAVASDSYVRFYSRGSATPLWEVFPQEHFYAVAISADGDCVVAGGQTGVVWFWKNAISSTGNPDPTWGSVDLSGPIERRCLDISDDGNYVAACGTGQYVFYWAGAKGLSGYVKPFTWKSPNLGSAHAVDISSDGDYVATGGDSYVAYWRNARTLAGNPQNPDWKSTKPTDKIVDIAISDDGNYVAAAGSAGFSPVYYWANAKSLSDDPSTKWDSAAGVDFSSIDISSDGDSVIAGGTGPDPADAGVYFWAGSKGLSGTPNPTWVYPTQIGIHDVAIDDAGDYMAAAQSVAIPHRAYFFSRFGDLKWSFDLDNPSLVVSISGDGGTLAIGTSEPETAYLLSTGFSTPQSRPVGGVVTPTNKLEILTPYLALAGLIIAVSTVVVVKKRSRD